MVNLLTVASKYLAETVFPKKKNFELDPTTTVARVALFFYLPAGTKPSINDFKIDYDLPSNMQPLVRIVYHTSREDLGLIDTAITKALKKTPPYKGTFYNQLFSECLKGLAALEETYKSSSITCMAIEKITSYIQIELDRCEKLPQEDAFDDPLYTEKHIRALSADFEIISELYQKENEVSRQRYCRRIIELLNDQDCCYKQSLVDQDWQSGES